MSFAKRSIEEQLAAEPQQLVSDLPIDTPTILVEAKFAGECGWCDDGIKPNQVIGHFVDDREDQSKWVHADCIYLNQCYHHAMDKDD